MVLAGPPGTDDGVLLVVVRNNTSKPAYGVEVSGTARDASGALVGSGSSQRLVPPDLGPGQIAIGYVRFRLNDNTTATTFQLRARPPAPPPPLDAERSQSPR